MKRLMGLVVLAFFLLPVRGYSETRCGEEGLTCEDQERCCERVIAIFADDHAAAPPYVQGQCIPQDQKCGDFWCGNEECKSRFYGTPSVCCINSPVPGAAKQYSCAFSELSCPGNSQRLTIRDSQPSRTLRRG